MSGIFFAKITFFSNFIVRKEKLVLRRKSFYTFLQKTKIKTRTTGYFRTKRSTQVTWKGDEKFTVSLNTDAWRFSWKIAVKQPQPLDSKGPRQWLAELEALVCFVISWSASSGMEWWKLMCALARSLDDRVIQFACNTDIRRIHRNIHVKHTSFSNRISQLLKNSFVLFFQLTKTPQLLSQKTLFSHVSQSWKPNEMFAFWRACQTDRVPTHPEILGNLKIWDWLRNVLRICSCEKSPGKNHTWNFDSNFVLHGNPGQVLVWDWIYMVRRVCMQTKEWVDVLCAKQAVGWKKHTRTYTAHAGSITVWTYRQHERLDGHTEYRHRPCGKRRLCTLGGGNCMITRRLSTWWRKCRTEADYSLTHWLCSLRDPRSAGTSTRRTGGSRLIRICLNWRWSFSEIFSIPAVLFCPRISLNSKVFYEVLLFWIKREVPVLGQGACAWCTVVVTGGPRRERWEIWRRKIKF